MIKVDCRAVFLPVLCPLLSAETYGRESAESANRTKIDFEITEPTMVRALMQFTEQSGLQLAFPIAGTDELRAPQVVGNSTPAAALDKLFIGSGLRYEFANERTISVRIARNLHDQDPAESPDRLHLVRQVGGRSSTPDAPLDIDQTRPTRSHPIVGPDK